MLKLDNELLENLESFVYSIIKKYSNESNREDLYQVAMLALMYASKNYDKSKNVKFTSYAYMYILGEVLKYIREDRNIRPSKELLRDYSKIIKAKEYIYKSHGKNVSNSELSKILKMDETRIEEVLMINQKEMSLNKIIPSCEENELTLEDIISKKETLDEIDLINLRNAIKCLSPEEKRLIYERYFENKSQTEIAKENKTTQVKVYRYERKVLDKLKDKMV